MKAARVWNGFPNRSCFIAAPLCAPKANIEIAAGATLLMGEVFCAGRIGRGESWAFESYENRLRVHLDGELIYVNQSALHPQKFAPQRVGIFENFTHSATFLAFASDISADKLRTVLDDCPAVYGGVSALENYGVICFATRSSCL